MEDEEMRYLILGAGAIGGYFGAMLLRGGADLSFMVRPKRAAQLAKRISAGWPELLLGFSPWRSVGQRTIRAVAAIRTYPQLACTKASCCAGGGMRLFFLSTLLRGGNVAAAPRPHVVISSLRDVDLVQPRIWRRVANRSWFRALG